MDRAVMLVPTPVVQDITRAFIEGPMGDERGLGGLLRG
jgi:hypothetical protein